MKKIFSLVVLLTLCTGTVFAVQGKECLKYLYGKWGIRHNHYLDIIDYYDDKGYIALPEPVREDKGQVRPPAIRYRYKSVSDDSYIDYKTAKGVVRVTFDGLGETVYFFDGLKQFRVKGEDGTFYIFFKISNETVPKGYKITDYEPNGKQK